MIGFLSDCLVVLYTFMATVGIFAIGLVLKSIILIVAGLIWVGLMIRKYYDGRKFEGGWLHFKMLVRQKG